MKTLTLVWSYYKNPKMLKRQIQEWNTYSISAISNLEIIVVDDGSPVGQRAEEVLERQNASIAQSHGVKFSEMLEADFRLFRILVDLPWYQRGAHNLGLSKASGDWVMWVDIDHIVTAELFEAILSAKLDPDVQYSFERINYHTREKHHPHKETRLMSKAMFDRIGGWDESFCGHYAFTERDYAERHRNKHRQEMFAGPPLEAVGLCDEFPDCRTKDLVRKEGRDDAAWQEIIDWKKENNIGVVMHKLPWKEIKL